MKRRLNKAGMSLVELLLAVSVLAMLAAFLIPAIQAAIRGRENAECSRKLRTAVEAFSVYAADTGSYPADKNPGEVPPEMEAYYFPYFKIDWWEAPAELGGQWDWDNGYNFKFSVSIASPSRSQEQMEEFDRMVDDGVLNAGRFRKVGTQYHYIIEE
jgi:prepilin-type N-terminal cleavage/methylation domain-containing protein